MTVSSTQSYIEYNGDGTTTSFTIPFYFLLNSDISAMVADASGSVSEPVNGTDFTVTGAGESGGGTLTANTAYPPGSTLLIYRNPPATQETKYYENGKFPATSHEAALDKLTMLIQEYGWRFDSLTLKKPGFFASYYDALNNRISNLAEPTAGADAVTKTYADAIGSGSKTYTDEQIAKEAQLREAADTLESDARAEADANIQDQLTGNVPLEASAFSEISWHGQQIKNSVVIPQDKNAWSFGPQMEIASGQQVTVSEGSSWTIADGRQVEDEDLHDLIADTLRTSDGSVTVEVDDIATNTNLTALTSRVSTAENDIDTLQTGLSTANTNISSKAAKGANSDITSLTGLTTPLSRSQGGSGQSDVSYLRAESTTATTLASAAFTKLVPTMVTDTKSAYSSGTWTCPDDGYYQISGFVRFAGSGTGYIKALLKLDSSSSPSTGYKAGQTVGSSFYANGGSGEAIMNLSCTLYLSKSSTYSLYAYHDYTAALTVAQQALQIIRVA